MRDKKTYIKFDNGSYLAEPISEMKRDEFVSTNRTFFRDLPDDKRSVKLGNLWDAARKAVAPAALPADSTPAKEVKPAKAAHTKPADTDPKL